MNGRDPWALVAAAAAAILLVSLLPVPDLAFGGAPGGGGTADPLPTWVSLTTPFHLVGYAVLGALAARAARSSPAIGRLRRADADGTGHRRTGGSAGTVVAAAVGIAVATAVGFGVELAQSTIPWRSFAWIDAGVNAIGAVGGASGYAIRQAVSRVGRP
ncbi:VanZ family protein [Halorubrum pallidum]